MENFLWVHLLSGLKNHSSEASYVLSFKYLACEALPLSAEIYLMWELCIRSRCKSQWQTQGTNKVMYVPYYKAKQKKH